MIGVECPHCETTFQFDAIMAGKSVRCPNPDCRDVFVVPGPIAADPVPIVDAEVVTAQIPTSPAPKKRLTPQASPRVVRWQEPAPAENKKRPVKDSQPEPEEAPTSRRRKRGRLQRAMFLFAVLGTIGTLAAGGWLLFKKAVLDERQTAKDAERYYSEGKYGEAGRTYEELIRDYPTADDIDKYKFFASISAIQAAVSSPTAKENPAPPRQQFDEFLAEFGDSPQARSGAGYGADVVQAGQKLATALSEHAADRVKAYRADRTKSDTLTAAGKAISDGRALLETVKRFRGKDEAAPPDYENRFAAVAVEIAKEQERLTALAPWRTVAKDPTDEQIAQYEIALKAAGLTTDIEALALLAAAQKKLRSLVVYTPETLLPQTRLPEEAPFALAAPAVAGVAPVKVPPGQVVVPDAVFAVARGILYALDAHTGELLWGTRVGPVTPDARTTDLPVRVGQPDTETNWVIVAAANGLTARRTRTGEVVWHQPLTSTCLGRPVALGGSLFVPLADALGSILQIQISTGELVGRIALRQPIGTSISVIPGSRPGHGFLVVPADARRIFLFEAGKEDAEGKRLPLRPAAVLTTGHAKDSLLSEPVVIGAEDPTGDRRLLLTISDGPSAMKLQMLALPKTNELEATTDAIDSRPSASHEVALSGWSAFPPISNGERIAITSDTGVFAIFGIGQPGSMDKPLFPLAGTPALGEQDRISRGQIVAAEDDSYWVIRDGQLSHWKSALEPATGPRFITVGTPMQVGEPICRGQVRTAPNLGYIVVRNSNSTATHMTAFDLSNGTIRWQRQLGVHASLAPIPLDKISHLIVDDAGGVYRSTLAGATNRISLDVATAPGMTTGAAIATSTDGMDIWVVLPTTTRDGPRLELRKYREGKLMGEGSLATADHLAGRPLVMGDQLLLPMSSGFLIRGGLTNIKPQQGPLWRGGKTATDAVCHLAAIGADGFVATDGENRFLRWRWSADQAQATRVGNPAEVRDRIVLGPVTYQDGEQTRIAIADAGGTVSLFDAEKLTEPMRKWRGLKGGKIPPGVPGVALRVIRTDDGTRLVHAIDRRAVVCLNPGNADPAWVNDRHSLDDLQAIELDGKQLYLTDRAGTMQSWDASTGAISGETARNDTGTSARVGGSPLGESGILLPRDDGTITRVPLLPVVARPR